LGTPALGEDVDKDDWAAMMVTMCHIETMIGRTIVVDSGWCFIEKRP
jgi:hypothetical protein